MAPEGPPRAALVVVEMPITPGGPAEPRLIICFAKVGVGLLDQQEMVEQVLRGMADTHLMLHKMAQVLVGEEVLVLDQAYRLLVDMVQAAAA